MSDVMFMLETHLSGAQHAALQTVVNLAQEQGVKLYLAGGAVRDMYGGFGVRDLDFVIEAPPAKFVKALEKAGATVVSTDDVLKQSELLFAGGVTASVAMSRTERYAKPGAKPQLAAAPIHDHLRGRDFTVNAMALSLNKGSRGLLIDPTNGHGDLQARELRGVSNYGFYDDPSRMLRLIRLRTRLGFAVADRTRSQLDNAKEAGVAAHIGKAALRNELLKAGLEPNPGELLRAWDEEGLLSVFSPALQGPKVNHEGFQKLQKAQLGVPFGANLLTQPAGLFLSLLLEGLSAKERSSLVEQSGLTAEDQSLWTKLETRAKKLEKEVASPKLNRASLVYQVLSAAPGEEVLLLACRSENKLVQDRVKNYLQRYLAVATEVTDAEVDAKGAAPGTPAFLAAKAKLIAARLDGRAKRPETPVVEAAPVAVPVRRFN